MSRSIVRTLTSKRSASRRAARARGAVARSSSTSAYRRSVRFIVVPRYRGPVTARRAIGEPSASGLSWRLGGPGVGAGVATGGGQHEPLQEVRPAQAVLAVLGRGQAGVHDRHGGAAVVGGEGELHGGGAGWQPLRTGVPQLSSSRRGRSTARERPRTGTPLRSRVNWPPGVGSSAA